MKVRELITELRSCGGIINSRIVKAVAKGAILAEDRTLLYKNGGHIQLRRDWAHSLLKRVSMVKYRGNTTTKPVTKVVDAVKETFQSDNESKMKQYKIPPQRIINWDHTGVQLVPVSTWKMAEKGSDKIELLGLDDNR